MQQLMHRALMICAATLFGALASPSGAQQTVPDQPPSTQQTPTSVPPAPPPERQTSPATPPPFPPMPSRAPRHRWVDMGEHHSSRARHRTTHVSHRTTHVSHRTKTARRSVHGRHSAHAHHTAAPSLSKKAIRRCHGMTYRQLLRHKDCASLLQSELNAAAHSKHHSRKHKASVTRHKTARKHEAKHKPATRHHRR